jgi:arsenate reductase-like glutaredoxin family protein
MKEIERATLAFAEARAALASQIMELNAELEHVKRTRLAVIRRAVAKAADKHAELNVLLTDNPNLFQKPKTRTLHGVKVGYQKQPGAIEIADEADTIDRIKKMFADNKNMLRQLIKTTEKPVKDALSGLSGEKLQKLGVTVTNDVDKVVIKPADSEVDKIVDALLKGATEEE